MSSKLFNILLAIVMVPLFVCSSFSSEYIPGELLVKLKPNTNYKIQSVQETNYNNVQRIKVPIGLEEQYYKFFKRLKYVEYVEPNYIIEPAGLIVNDPYINLQWAINKIRLPDVWVNTIGNSNIIIGVIDSGLDTTHPDLAGQYITGWNVITNTTDTVDTFGHGTKVAGTIIAIGNNSIGIAGTSWNCKVMPIKVDSIEGGKTTSYYLSNGIIYAATHGCKVLNISYCYDSYISTVHSAINTALSNGCSIVSSSGNDGSTSPNYPAAHDGVISVGASNQDDCRAWFSSCGSTMHIVAPGEEIYTTELGGGYGNHSGTSFSSPIVAGIVALMLDTNPNLTNNSIVDIINLSAIDINTLGFDDLTGYGRLDAVNAIRMSLEYPNISYSFTENNITNKQYIVKLLVSNNMKLEYTCNNKTFSVIRIYNNITNQFIKGIGITRSPVNLPLGYYQSGEYRLEVSVPTNTSISYTLNFKPIQ